MAINEKMLSIDADDDNEDYQAFSEFLQEDTERKKWRNAEMINELGDLLVKSVEKKRKVEKLKAEKLIPYILRHTDTYSKEELTAYSFKDVQDIYDEIKKEHKPFFIKFFHFLFNID
jgi:hypothetical protein